MSRWQEPGIRTKGTDTRGMAKKKKVGCFTLLFLGKGLFGLPSEIRITPPLILKIRLNGWHTSNTAPVIVFAMETVKFHQ